MMASTIAAPAKRSWAQIVEGDSEKVESSQKGLKPGARGSLLRFCRGKVLSMLSQYGWLMALGDIDHPSVEKHGGDVYIHKDDVVGGDTLRPGDIVTFYLYVDEKGLGAEECRVEQRASLWWNTSAAEFQPLAVKQGDCPKCTTEELVQIKPAVYEHAMDDPVTWRAVSFRLAHALAHVFTSDDEDSEDEDDPCMVTSSKTKRAPSSNGSTIDGGTSDSEGDMSLVASSESEDEEEASFEAPAGITKIASLRQTLPLNFRPPPGLTHPSDVDEM
jgi:cold shock CspA family protein